MLCPSLIPGLMLAISLLLTGILAFIYREIKTAKRLNTTYEKMLADQEKLALLGDIAGSIAHEINTPLVAATLGMDKITQYTHTLREFYEQHHTTEFQDEQMNRFHQKYPQQVELIKKALNHLTRQMTNLKHFVKFQDVQENFNVNLEIETALGILGFKMGNEMEITKNLDPNLPEITGNASALEQVFMNLIKNAFEAKHENRPGQLAIKTYADPTSIYLEFKDNGTGITSDNLKKLFRKKFTTKQTGTGFGLSLSNEIIQRHRGKILVASTPGEGTTFTVVLPKN